MGINDSLTHEIVHRLPGVAGADLCSVWASHSTFSSSHPRNSRNRRTFLAGSPIRLTDMTVVLAAYHSNRDWPVLKPEGRKTIAHGASRREASTQSA
jgi:hypothetical protein